MCIMRAVFRAVKCKIRRLPSVNGEFEHEYNTKITLSDTFICDYKCSKIFNPIVAIITLLSFVRLYARLPYR